MLTRVSDVTQWLEIEPERYIMGFSLYAADDAVIMPDLAKVTGRGRPASEFMNSICERSESLEVGESWNLYRDNNGNGFPAATEDATDKTGGKAIANRIRSGIGTMLSKRLGPSGMFFIPRVAGFEDGGFVSIAKLDQDGEPRKNKNGKAMMTKSYFVIQVNRVEKKTTRKANSSVSIPELDDSEESDDS